MEEDNHKFKVKIVAIAKDEAAYLPEWIFHHLYFGFDAIDIYVNRTTDNTCDVLDKISNQYSNVNYFYADWIEMLPREASKYMQRIIYSQAFQDEKMKHIFTHILYIDIDEFWTPINFQDSIHDCLLLLPKYASISFQWFNILGEKIAFNNIPSKINGFLSPLVKSIYPTDLNIKFMGLHLSRFHENSKFKGYFLSDGTTLVHNKEQPEHLTNAQANSIRPYVILHRMFRSEIEYISMLYRGNPENSSQIKLNRMGFREKMAHQKHIDFEYNAYNKYKNEKEYFFTKLQLDNELAIAKSFVLNRAQLTIKALQNEINNNDDKLIIVLQGLKNTKISSIFENIINSKKIIEKIKLEFEGINIQNFKRPEELLEEMVSIFTKYKKNKIANNIIKEKVLICKIIKNFKEPADNLREIAFIFEEKNDFNTACEVMEVASWFRPNGLGITSKLKEYKRALQEKNM